MYGKPVDEIRAKTVGLYFLKNKTNSAILKNAATLQLSYKVTAKFGNALEERVMFYVFNVDRVGFVIVAGDDTVIPILGYSDQGNFVSNKMPLQIQKWLQGYKNEIVYVVSNNIKETTEINNLWNYHQFQKNSNYSLTSSTVSPLIQTRWDQIPYYNSLCPFDTQYNERSVTGCVATAMAQVMKYWNYPTIGSDFHSYNHTKYGRLSANFGNTIYQWASMPNQVTSSNISVATLMYHCGVSVDMNYGTTQIGGSSAQTLDVVNALKKYFNYSNLIQGLYRKDYSDTQWINLLKNELDASRPIQYAGTGNGGGHSFVCDGYDVNTMFHFNWGWSGQSDGYFQLNALNPGSLGSGGGSGGFNSNQRAIIGIQPPASYQSYNLFLYNDVTPSATSISYGEEFTVTTNIGNYGTNNFSGDYVMSVFDSNGNFIDNVETKLNYGTLEGGSAYASDLVFTTTGMFSMLPGTYYLGLYYRPTGGGWKVVQDKGSYTNFSQITVVNSNPISLNSIMTVSPSTTLTQGQAASVNLNISNEGFSTFFGQYNVSLYTIDGEFVETIGEITEDSGLPSGFTYNFPYLTFSTDAITASPGTYLIALQHKETIGDWELSGSTENFINPIKVTVIQAPYLADKFENNDTFAQSYSLPLNFIGNIANTNTFSSNCHIGTDNDYYKISLPTGHNYTITPRLHDSFSSSNGNIYTIDGIFSYSTDGLNWSNAFDDEISGNITVNNGGVIYFHVAPYFQGNIGTYLLDVNLTRTTTLGVQKNELAENMKVYPNPTNSKIFFDNSIYNFENVSVLNCLGQEVSKIEFTSFIESQEIDLSILSKGVYVLKFEKS